MFTGIIEDIGIVKQVAATQLEIISKLTDVKLGDSIAVNGVCLTVSALADNRFTFDVMALTMRDTNLSELRTGAMVNLERAMPADGRFGGHFVSGHVDETGLVEKIDSTKILWLKIKPENKKFLALKGSVTVNGVSLTIQAVQEQSFAVSLVAHTLTNTTLQNLRTNDKVNIEYDLLMRYIQNLLPDKPQTSLRKFL